MGFQCMQIDGRVYCKGNRRLYCLKEYQKLRQQDDPNFVLKMKLMVRISKDETFNEIIKARASSGVKVSDDAEAQEQPDSDSDSAGVWDQDEEGADKEA